MTAAVAVAALVAVAGALAGWAAPETRLRRTVRRPRDALRRGGGVHRPSRERAGPPVDVLLDLVAAAMRAGAPPARALAMVADACPGEAGDALAAAGARQLLGAGAREAWDGLPPRLAPVRDALALSAAAGVPAADLLAAAADDERRSRRRRAHAAAARLGVRLTLPTGLCALPAFVAWGVVPVVLSLAGSTAVP